MRLIWISLMVLSLLLTGCSKVDLSDVSTGVSATGAAVVASVVTANPAIIAGATLTGATAGAILVEDDKSLTVEQIKEVDNPWQAMLVALDQLLAYAWEIVIAIGIATIGIPMLITYLLGRAKQRPEDAKAISNLVDKIGKMKE
jgi:uncharacterized protein YceK